MTQARAHITIRPATTDDASGIARVHVDSWRTTYRGIVPDEYLASLSYEKSQARREAAYHPDAVTYVAVDGSGRIIGFACGARNRDGDIPYTGELSAIYLLEQCQGCGIGRQLVSAVADDLTRRGHLQMVVWVLSDNRPARGFYEALGGRLLRSKIIEIGGVQLEETEYVWDDISILTSTVA